MDGRKTVAEMTGELLGEVGALIVVFYPVGEGFAQQRRPTVLGIVASVSLGVLLWLLGVLVERERTT
jgi:hypothetical protein